MSDVLRGYRCISCGGAFDDIQDDDVPAPSIGVLSVATEGLEFMCNDCGARLARENRNRAPAGPKRISSGMTR